MTRLAVVMVVAAPTVSSFKAPTDKRVSNMQKASVKSKKSKTIQNHEYKQRTRAGEIKTKQKKNKISDKWSDDFAKMRFSRFYFRGPQVFVADLGFFVFF